MKPTNVLKALATARAASLAHQARTGDIIVPFIWGPPGLGKSAVAKLFFASIDMVMTDLRLSQLEPYDLRGLPSIDKGITVWNVPSFLPGPDDPPTAIFLDEFNQAPKEMSAPAYQLVQNGRIGDWVMAPQHWLVGAGNRETDRAIVSKMGTALKSRFIHIDFDLDNDDWIRWALNNDIMPEVIAFFRFRPELLYTFDPLSTDREYSCPRTAEFLSNVLRAGPPPEIEFDMFKGCVGEGVAAEFHGFLKIYRTLPDVDAVLLNPDKAPVPTDPATLFALVGALARKANEKTAERLVKYANRLPDEFSVVLMRDATELNSDVQHTSAFAKWISKHSDLLGH